MPQAWHHCASRLSRPGSVHSLEPNSTQSSSLRNQLPRDNTVSVFLDEWPHLIGNDRICQYVLYFLVMHHLPFDSSPLYESRHSIERASRYASNTSKTAPLTMGLQDSVNFFRTELASIVEGIKGVTKSMVTFRAFKSLMTFGSTAMFMSLETTAEWTFHKFRSQCQRVIVILSHTSLIHNPIFCNTTFYSKSLNPSNLPAIFRVA